MRALTAKFSTVQQQIGLSYVLKIWLQSWSFWAYLDENGSGIHSINRAFYVVKSVGKLSNFRAIIDTLHWTHKGQQQNLHRRRLKLHDDDDGLYLTMASDKKGLRTLHNRYWCTDFFSLITTRLSPVNSSPISSVLPFHSRKFCHLSAHVSFAAKWNWKLVSPDITKLQKSTLHG